MQLRLLFFIASFVVVAQYAKGYRFDTNKWQFNPTGILVATSTPDAAQVFINGTLKTATNQSINLTPGTYDVEIVKDGFFPWKKRLTITASVVTTTNAFLFTRAASLSPLTFGGATHPILSPDGTKLAWVVPAHPTGGPQNPETPDKTGVWVLELGNLPFGFAREARQASDVEVGKDNLLSWSPDSRSIILERANGIFLVDPGSFTPQSQLVNIKGQRLAQLQKSWSEYEKKKRTSLISKLPQEVADIVIRKTESFVFSPDETKVIYTASGSATIPDNLIPSLPGASTQRQERDIKTSRTYVYDIKEDRNFLVEENGENLIIGNWKLEIGNSSRRLAWLPTSRHLVLTEENNISILEYDGTNRVSVWSGPYEEPSVFPAPSSDQLIVLTNFGATTGELPNLYTIKLR
ncbi:PEGA domain-containing protein [Candidatus Microgenomates bacterium]|nr:PEGA domain-containing protein [Candidatus Microgenomates bacterium]